MASPDENVVEVPLSVVRVFTLSNPAKFSWETVRARLSLFTESVITSSDEQPLNSATTAIKTILLIIFVFITCLYYVTVVAPSDDCVHVPETCFNIEPTSVVVPSDDCVHVPEEASFNIVHTSVTVPSADWLHVGAVMAVRVTLSKLKSIVYM